MRLINIVVAVAVAGPVSAQVAQPSQESAAVGSVAPAAPQLGKIIMYRGSSVFGAGIACPIRYKGQEVVELARGKYAEWNVPAGRYILNNHTSSIEVSVDPGETQYVRCMIKTGFFAGRADLQIVDEESFSEHRNQFEQKPVELTSPPLK